MAAAATRPAVSARRMPRAQCHRLHAVPPCPVDFDIREATLRADKQFDVHAVVKVTPAQRCSQGSGTLTLPGNETQGPLLRRRLYRLVQQLRRQKVRHTSPPALFRSFLDDAPPAIPLAFDDLQVVYDAAFTHQRRERTDADLGSLLQGPRETARPSTLPGAGLCAPAARRLPAARRSIASRTSLAETAIRLAS